MRKGNFYIIIWLGTIILGLGVLASISYIYLENKKMSEVVYRDIIYKNIYVENIDVGDLSIEQAQKKLNEKFASDTDAQRITFKYNEMTLELPFKEIDAGYMISKAVQEAYEIGRYGSLSQRYKLILELENTPRNIYLDYYYDEGKLLEYANKIEAQVNIEAQNSKFLFENGIFTGTSEVIGKKLNKEILIFQTKELLNEHKSGIIELIVSDILPEYTKAYYEAMNNNIGKFSTIISDGAENRTENIKAAAGKINGVLLYPQEVFSVNKTISPIAENNGYFTAPIIINGKLQDGIGGGVCQVATTLYNAVINSELEIIERQSHSRPVGYVELGMDATLAGDYIDLKFRNSTQYPIYIACNTEGNVLSVNIYGYKDNAVSREISFESKVVEIIEPPEQKVIKDDTKFEDEVEVVSEAKVGYRVIVYKNIYKDGVLIDKAEFSSSTYKAVQAEIKIGTKPRQ